MVTVPIIEITRGDVVILDASITEDNVPVDLSGVNTNVIFTVKTDFDDADEDALCLLQVGSGIVKTNAAQGQVRITVPREATVGLPNDKPYNVRCDMKLIDGPDIYTVYEGKIIIKQTIYIGG